jgi:hypothetical protein
MIQILWIANYGDLQKVLVQLFDAEGFIRFVRSRTQDFRWCLVLGFVLIHGFVCWRWKSV